MINTTILRPIYWKNLVRIGNEYDGGYVIPDELLSKTDVLLSFGINKDWSFEKSFRRKNQGATIHCYDHTLNYFMLLIYTIKSIFLAPVYCVTFDRVRLKRCILGMFIIPDYYLFFSRNAKHFKNRIWNNNEDKNKTIDNTFNQIPKPDRKNIFIKMDIEEAEYLVFDDIINSVDFIRGMAVEFHAIGKNEEEFNKIIKVLLKDFHIVHIHGNNYSDLLVNQNFPSTIEITFINKNYCYSDGKISNVMYPIEGLDKPNKISRPDYNLEF